MPINKKLKEKNESDYLQMTERITTALDELRNNYRIPATQERLAKMSGCSRKTLHNRVWVLADLKKIKEERRLRTIEDPNTDQINTKTKAQVRENLLIEENENLQEENAILFDKLQESEYRLSQALRLNSILENENSFLRKNTSNVKNKLVKEIKLVGQD